MNQQSYHPSSTDEPGNATIRQKHGHHCQRPSLAGFDPFLTVECSDDDGPRGPHSSRYQGHKRHDTEPTLADLHASHVIIQSQMNHPPRGQASGLLSSPASSRNNHNHAYHAGSVSPISPHTQSISYHTGKEMLIDGLVADTRTVSFLSQAFSCGPGLDSIDQRQPTSPSTPQAQNTRTTTPTLSSSTVGTQQIAPKPRTAVGVTTSSREPVEGNQQHHTRAMNNTNGSVARTSRTERETSAVAVDCDESTAKGDGSGSNNNNLKLFGLPSSGSAGRKVKGSRKKTVHRRTKSLDDKPGPTNGTSTAVAVTAESEEGTGSSFPVPGPPLHRVHNRSQSHAPPFIGDATQLSDSENSTSSTSSTPNSGRMSSSNTLRNFVLPRRDSWSRSRKSGVMEGPVVSRSGYGNGIVQDLMDMKEKFTTLQIPSLAKLSPTSFLTGNSNEAVRTSEFEPSPFQLELPTLPEAVEIARLNDFVENYRRLDQNYDLQQLVGTSQLELQNKRSAHHEHTMILQSLLECGPGLTIQGFMTVGTNSDDRLEAVVFEGQRYFTVVFRGRTEQQAKLIGNNKSKRQAVPLDANQVTDVEVYNGFKEEYSKLERESFALVDKLSEQNPFCDFVFTGYSFGAALATIAAVRYASVRPMMRIGCVPMASPKVGFNMFRHMVNSLPNLRVTRIELGQDSKCQSPSSEGFHVGHTIVLHSMIGQQHFLKSQDNLVVAYRFDGPKPKKFKSTHPDLHNYVIALEECQALAIPWVVDFVNTTGRGVVVNNEARLVV